MSTQTISACTRTCRTPDAIASATSTALRHSLNESGAMTMRMQTTLFKFRNGPMAQKNLLAGANDVAWLTLLEGFDIIDELIKQPLYGFLTGRSEEQTSDLQSLMRISYSVFCF